MSDDLNMAVAIARARVKAQADAQSATKPTFGQDVMQSAPSYLARGAAGFADSLMSLSPASLVARAGNALQAPVGETGDSFAPASDIAQSAAPEFMGKEAKTTGGKYVGAVAEGLPYMAAGPGGGARGIISNVAGSLAGEAAAQQVPEDSIFHPFARLLGNLTGGLATAGAPRMREGIRAANIANKVRTLTGDELKQATDFMYQSLRDADVHYNADEFAKLGPQLYQDLSAGSKMRGSNGVPLQEEAFSYVDRLTRMAGKAPDFGEIDALQSELGQAVRDAYKANAGMGNNRLANALETVQDKLDDFVTNVPLQHMPNLKGNTPPMSKAEMITTRTAARDLALRNIKGRRIREAMETAENDPNGFTAGINREFGALVKRPYNRKLFNPDELKMIGDVAGGKGPMTLLGHFGIDLRHPSAFQNVPKALGAAGIPLAAAMGAGPVSIAAGAGILGAGTLAKTIGEPIMKRKNAESVASAIRGTADGAITEGAMAATKQETNWRRLRWLMTGAQAGAAGNDMAMKTPRG